MKTYKEIAKFHRFAAAELKTPNCDGTFDDSELSRTSIQYHEMVAEACEKQIPKKPIEGHTFKHIGKCPDCGQVISARSASRNCQYCGQKIDWGYDEKKTTKELIDPTKVESDDNRPFPTDGINVGDLNTVTIGPDRFVGYLGIGLASGESKTISLVKKEIAKSFDINKGRFRK